ncbi:MAG TPA: AMP-binding protein [Gemmatimonadaceae bacterium]|jgi:long-chain acyl-CoA synthetase|nr:AMP-binding protein [Gemmatimonadaceae bacterium]
MPDPFSLLPLAIAAHGGRIDEFESQQLVAAGLTLLRRSAPLVRALAGRRSAILLPPSPHFYVALAASEGRGAVLIDPLATEYEIAHQIGDANVGAVFTNGTLATRVPRDLTRVLLDAAPWSAHVIANGIGRDVDLGSHAGLALEGEIDATGSSEEAAIVYTSAMRGVPLGAVLSHRNLLANARSAIVAGQVTNDDTVLAVLPFSYLFGLTVAANAPLLTGARVVTMDRFHPAQAVQLISSGGITQIVGVPAVFRELLGACERRGARAIGDLRLCICGGAPLSAALQDRWADATGVELRQVYGLTEGGPICLFNRVDRPNARGTLGVALPGVDVRIDRDEICVRGDNVFTGYVSGDDAGLEVNAGWLRTGDRGRANADGTISFAGTMKPMFMRNGFNVYPAEIERAVRGLPGVAAVNVRSVDAGEGRDADIELEVRGTVSADEVRRWCADRLSASKQPSRISVA